MSQKKEEVTVPNCAGLLMSETAGVIQQLRCTRCSYAKKVAGAHIQQLPLRSEPIVILAEEQGQMIACHLAAIEAALSQSCQLFETLLVSTPLRFRENIMQKITLIKEASARYIEICKSLSAAPQQDVDLPGWVQGSEEG